MRYNRLGAAALLQLALAQHDMNCSFCCVLAVVTVSCIHWKQDHQMYIHTKVPREYSSRAQDDEAVFIYFNWDSKPLRQTAITVYCNHAQTGYTSHVYFSNLFTSWLALLQLRLQTLSCYFSGHSSPLVYRDQQWPLLRAPLQTILAKTCRVWLSAHVRTVAHVHAFQFTPSLAGWQVTTARHAAYDVRQL